MSLSLIDSTLYTTGQNDWYSWFDEIPFEQGKLYNLDVAAIANILDYHYPTGDRTLIQEISRQPWLSEIDQNGAVELLEIPPHKLFWRESKDIAKKLESLLCREAETACDGRDEIYILLSGGLDSRILAGIMNKLYEQGRLIRKPVAVTWGIEKSRDVVYAKGVATLLGIEWIHIPVSSEILLDDIDVMSTSLGCLSTPVHLHYMSWFKNVSKNALVLAGSYGDSIGRAEFSHKHVLMLDYIQPYNAFGLLKKNVALEAREEIAKDCEILKTRAGNVREYVHHEHQMQGFYMRNMNSHNMGIINKYCKVYQMFTSPEVYSYMWSLYPLCRNDDVYAVLLESLSSDLARLPWARTNKSLRGKTVGAKKGLAKNFHKYKDWISKCVWEKYKDIYDADWYDSTGIFEAKSISNLGKLVRHNSGYGLMGHETWLWLVAFRKYVEALENRGAMFNKVRVNDNSLGDRSEVQLKHAAIRKIIRENKYLYNMANKCRKIFRSCKFRWQCPPEQHKMNL